jgi:hypothetical protein
LFNPPQKKKIKKNKSKSICIQNSLIDSLVTDGEEEAMPEMEESHGVGFQEDQELNKENEDKDGEDDLDLPEDMQMDAEPAAEEEGMQDAGEGEGEESGPEENEENPAEMDVDPTAEQEEEQKGEYWPHHAKAIFVVLKSFGWGWGL